MTSSSKTFRLNFAKSSKQKKTVQGLLFKHDDGDRGYVVSAAGFPSSTVGHDLITGIHFIQTQITRKASPHIGTIGTPTRSIGGSFWTTVYNVSGPQPIPLSVLIRVAGRQRLPVPEPVFAFALGRFGLPPLPTGALAHVKYPVVIDSSVFREATGWTHQFDEVQCMESFRWAHLP